jgi:hypothetical protein
VTSCRPGFFVSLEQSHIRIIKTEESIVPYYSSPSRDGRRSPVLKAVLATMSLGAVLVACSASRETSVADATAGQCDASRADHLIGENYSGYVERQALAESGATEIRVLKPDDAATMDFNPRRLNLHVDPGLVIIKVACG